MTYVYVRSVFIREYRFIFMILATDANLCAQVLKDVITLQVADSVGVEVTIECGKLINQQSYHR